MQAVRDSLDPNKSMDSLKTFGLYCMGRVGKNQIALQYASGSRKQYDAILCVSANNTITMGQSFRNIAQSLGLASSNEEMQDNVAVVLKVKAWCNNARECIFKNTFPLKSPNLSN